MVIDNRDECRAANASVWEEALSLRRVGAGVGQRACLPAFSASSRAAAGCKRASEALNEQVSAYCSGCKCRGLILLNRQNTSSSSMSGRKTFASPCVSLPDSRNARAGLNNNNETARSARCFRVKLAWEYCASLVGVLGGLFQAWSRH